MNKILCISTAIFLSICLNAQQTGSFTDKRDGRTYKTVKIGDQTWMAENLAYKPDSGIYWTYENTAGFINKYGYLYHWETAKNVCPTGWHLPSKSEFETLLSTVGGKGIEVYKALVVGGRSGFSAMNGGWRNYLGAFQYIGGGGYWWSATETDTDNAWRLCILSYRGANIAGFDKVFDHSVRCIKNKVEP